MPPGMYVDDIKFKVKKENFAVAIQALEQRGFDTELSENMLKGNLLRKNCCPSPLDETTKKMHAAFVMNIHFEPNYDENGNISALVFEGGGYYQHQEDFFNIIAKYVEAGSYISYQIKDTGEHYQWYFNGDCLVDKTGTVVYE